jgi:glycosyltransferase involved in cell wall biosynthesis
MSNETLNPIISVILPVYNAEKYIEEAINSILEQTYQNFELIIINDGSSDNSVNVINQYEKNNKVKIVNQENHGLIFTLNKGIDLAKGQYIARMDADDIAHPERFEKQLSLFEANPNLGVCSASTENFGAETDITIRSADNDVLKATLLFWPPFAHPAAMIKRSVLLDNKIYYREEFKHCEDFDLWSQLAPYCQFSNVTDVMLKYRVHPEQVTNSFSDVVLDAHFRICQRNLLEQGVELEKRDFMAFLGKEKHPDGFRRLISVYQQIIKANDLGQYYCNEVLKTVISNRMTDQVVDFYGVRGFIEINKVFGPISNYSSFSRALVGSIRRDLVNILK